MPAAAAAAAATETAAAAAAVVEHEDDVVLLAPPPPATLLVVPRPLDDDPLVGVELTDPAAAVVLSLFELAAVLEFALRSLRARLCNIKL